MNNIFEVQKYFITNGAKKKYENWETILNNYKKDEIYIKKYNRKYNTEKLRKHLYSIKYILYGHLPKKYGGVNKDDIELLKELYISSEQSIKNNKTLKITKQTEIYNQLFNLIITEQDILNPLCNCCLTEFGDKDKGWKTSKNKEREYFKDKDDIEYITSNYIHICPNCNKLLYQIQQYKELEMNTFNKNIFLNQSSEYIEYQSLCFSLLR
tara:strand:- start:332 stop:964 length:633 start_codon:yes stop_codon:yes gene_type:complete